MRQRFVELVPSSKPGPSRGEWHARTPDRNWCGRQEWLHINNGDFATVEKILTDLLAMEPDHVPAYCALAFVYKETDRFFEAEEALTKAVALDPSNRIACRSLANLLSLSGESGTREAALDLYRRVLRTDPSNSGALLNLGNSLLWLGRIDEATTVLNKLRSVSPHHAQMLSDDMESESSNFYLVCGMIAGFKDKYMKWPSTLHLRSYLMRALRNQLGPVAFATLQRRITIVELGRGRRGIQRIAGRSALGLAKGVDGEMFEFLERPIADEEPGLLIEVHGWLRGSPL